MAETRTVGQSLPRIDAPAKVRGEALFTADVRLPGLLAGKFLPSPYAHAEILAIDTSQALALPGVRAVITGADMPHIANFNPNDRFHAFMARRFVVYAGQPVAAVAAEDLATAEAALDLIRVEWRPLPAIVDPEAAIRPDSPVVSREAAPARDNPPAPAAAEPAPRPPNLAHHDVIEHGDLAAAWAESDVIVEGTYTLPRVHQGYLEPHTVTAWWDRADHVRVWACVQTAFEARNVMAGALGLPPTSITMEPVEVGGAFGGKDRGLFHSLVVLLAQKARRPVRLALTRREELTSANPAPMTRVWAKVGAGKDGTLTALETRVLLDAGAFTESQNALNVAVMVGENYRFQAWRLEALEALTTKAPIGSYRAPCAINATFAIESLLDEMARQIGVDPITLRQRNIICEGDLMVTMRPMRRNGARETLAALAALAVHPAWTSGAAAGLGADGRLHGRGVALGSWGSGPWPASATAELEIGGKFRFIVGQVDLTGSYTSLAQIAAETLGVSVSNILITRGSTDSATFAPVSGGSGTIYSMGSAIRAAALDLKAKIMQRAAENLDLPEADLALDDGGVFAVADPEKRCSLETLHSLGTNLFMAEYGPLVGQGSGRPKRGAATFAASIAEVAIDPETGRVTLTRLVTAQDVGTAINPMAVEGQIQGGNVQSAGVALWEEVMYDEQGQVHNPNLLDYRQPTAADVPMIETVLVDVPDGEGPFGAKGVGEPPMIPPVTAIANAVAAATGCRFHELPITPERVWRALKDK